ncbi:MAG: CHASE domain-containing protein [Verrucomicrobiota bacterium]
MRKCGGKPGCRSSPITLLALVASLGVAILLWRNSQAEVLSHARARFQFRTHEVEIALRQRMLAYEQVLRGGAGLITPFDARTRDKWRIYVERLQIDRNFPGIQGIGFSERIPRSQLEQHILAVQADGFPNYTVRPPGNRRVYLHRLS